MNNSSRPLIAEKNIMDGYQQQQQQQHHQLELNPPQQVQQQQHQQYYQQQQEHPHLYVPQVTYYNTQPQHYQHQQQQQQQQNYNYEQQGGWHNQAYYNQQTPQPPAPPPANNPSVNSSPGAGGSSFQSYFPQQQVHQHHHEQQQQQPIHRPLSVPPPTQSPLQQHTIDSSGVENNLHNNHSVQGGGGQVLPAPITNLARFVDTQQGQTGFIQHHHFQQQQQQQPQTFIPPVSSPSIQNHNQQNSNHINNNPIPTPPLSSSSVSSSGSGPISHSQQPTAPTKPNIPVSAFVASLPLLSPTTANSNSNQQHQQKQQSLPPSNQINANQPSPIPKIIKSPPIEVTNGITTNGTSNIIVKPPNVGVARTKASMRKLLMEQLEDSQTSEKSTTSPPHKPADTTAGGGSPKKNTKDKDNTPLSSTPSTPTKSGRGSAASGGRAKAEEKVDEEEAARILLELQKDPISKRTSKLVQSSFKSTNWPPVSKTPPSDEKRTSTRKRELSEKAESAGKITPKSTKATPSRVGKRKRKNEDDDDEEESPLDVVVETESKPKKERKERKYTYKKKVVREPGKPKLGRPPKNPSDDQDVDDVPIEGKRNSNLRKRTSTKITPTKKEKPQKEKIVKGSKKAKLSNDNNDNEKEKSTGKIARKSKASVVDESAPASDEKTLINNAETVEVEEGDESVVKTPPSSKTKKAPRPKLSKEELDVIRRKNLQKAKLAIALKMKAREEKARELKEKNAAISAQRKKAKLDAKASISTTILPPLDLTKLPESALKLEEGEIVSNASRISLSPPGTKQSQKMSKAKAFKLTTAGVDDDDGKIKKKERKSNKKEQQVIKIIETKPPEPPKIPGISPDHDGHSGEDLVALANEPENEEKITLFYEVSQGNQPSTSTALPTASQGEKINEGSDVKIIPTGGNKKKSSSLKKEKAPIVKKTSTPSKQKKTSVEDLTEESKEDAKIRKMYERSIVLVRETLKNKRKELSEKNKLQKLKEAEESGIPPPKRGAKKKQKEEAGNTRASKATLDEVGNVGVGGKQEIQIIDHDQNIVATSNSEIITTLSPSPRKLKDATKVAKTPKTPKSPTKKPQSPKKILEVNIDGEIIKSYDEKPRDFGEIPNIINNNQHVELNLKYPEINIIPIPRASQNTATATITAEVVVVGKKSSPKVKSSPKTKAIKTTPLVNLESPIRENSGIESSAPSPSILSSSAAVLAIPSSSMTSTPGSGSKPKPKKPSKATGKMIKPPLTLESRQQVKNTLFPRDIHLKASPSTSFSKSPTVSAYGPPLLTTRTGESEGGNQKSKKVKPSGPSIKMVNGKAKFKYNNGESEYPVDEIKKAEEKLPREKPQTEYDPNVPWLCCFCSKAPHEQRLGDLFGPYYLKTKLKVGKKLVSDGNPKETWLHENCAIWAGGVVLIDNSLKGLEAAIEHSNKTICTICNTKGATIGCLKRKCASAAHFPCAKNDKWKLNFDTYHSFCSSH